MAIRSEIRLETVLDGPQVRNKVRKYLMAIRSEIRLETVLGFLLLFYLIGPLDTQA